MWAFRIRLVRFSMSVVACNEAGDIWCILRHGWESETEVSRTLSKADADLGQGQKCCKEAEFNQELNPVNQGYVGLPVVRLLLPMSLVHEPWVRL